MKWLSNGTSRQCFSNDIFYSVKYEGHQRREGGGMDSSVWVVTHCFSEVSISQETQQSANWEYVVLNFTTEWPCSFLHWWRVARYFNYASLTGKLDSWGWAKSEEIKSHLKKGLTIHSMTFNFWYQLGLSRTVLYLWDITVCIVFKDQYSAHLLIEWPTSSLWPLHCNLHWCRNVLSSVDVQLRQCLCVCMYEKTHSLKRQTYNRTSYKYLPFKQKVCHIFLLNHRKHCIQIFPFWRN